MSILGNMVGAYSNLGKTVVIEDENGNELTGVITANEVLFTAIDSDVKKGSVYAGDHGVSVGTNNMPAYNYAIVDENCLCVNICGTHLNCDDNNYIAIQKYNPIYIGNYYNISDGKWYSDAEMTSEWIPPQE